MHLQRGQWIGDLPERLAAPVIKASSRRSTTTWKKTFSHHPLVALADHGQTGFG